MFVLDSGSGLAVWVGTLVLCQHCQMDCCKPALIAARVKSDVCVLKSAM